MKKEEATSMNKGDHLIWTSDPNYEDWREEIEADLPDFTEEERNVRSESR